MHSSLWYWVGLFGMVVGTIAIIVYGRNLRPGDRHHLAPAIFVPVISALGYFAVATKFGVLEGASGGVTYLPHYLDWLITRPLSLISLAVIALPAVKDFEQGRTRIALLSLLVGADLIAVSSALFADLSGTALQRWGWFAWSALGVVAVLYFLWQRLRKLVRSDTPVSGLYLQLAAVVSAAWIAYWCLWILGPSGSKVLSAALVTIVFVGLDLFVKVGLELFTIHGLYRLDRVAHDADGRSAVEVLVEDKGTDKEEL